VEQPGKVARGERAIYTKATDRLELTGSPSLETPQLIITEARTLVWDKANQGFSATAPYRIKIKLPDETVKKISGKVKP
jgi:hypothetical protein